MFHLQWDLFCTAIRALAIPLVEQILAELEACERALLIVDALYERALHFLKVELDHLLTDRCDRAEPHEALHPRLNVGYPAFQGRRQPPLLLVPPIVEAWHAIFRFSL